jgi:hypothetical protein
MIYGSLRNILTQTLLLIRMKDTMRTKGSTIQDDDDDSDEDEGGDDERYDEIEDESQNRVIVGSDGIFSTNVDKGPSVNRSTQPLKIGSPFLDQAPDMAG